MSRSKESSSRLHEKHQLILADLLRDEDNKYCADCMAKGPRWASWNLGVFMCIRCAGIHRNLGVHVSRVKSVNLDSWTPEQIESVQKGGNRHAKNLYEANLPANFRRPQDDYAVEQFIRAKYERKIYIAKGEVKSNKEPPTTQEQKTKVAKPKKVLSTSSNSIKSTGQEQNLAVPRPSGHQSPSPLSTSKSAPSSTRNSASNLLTLDSSPPTSSSQQTAPKSQPQPLLDLLTDTAPSSTVAPPTSKPASNSTSINQYSDPFTSSSSSSSSAAAANHSSNPVFGASFTPQEGSGHQQQPTGSKDSIMSLYSQNQPQYSSYTAQGYPVNNYYYQQQQAAAMHMAQVASLQQQQVSQVTAQMQKIKMNQTGGPVGAPQAFPGAMSNGSGLAAPSASMNMANHGAGGQTLNPTLW